MSASVFDHPFLSGLLGDGEISPFFSAEADIASMLSFEAALARAEAGEGVIEASAAEAITTASKDFVADMDNLRTATARDGVAVPALLRQLRVAIDPSHRDALHFGATSQDAIDTSLVLRLKPVLAIFGRRLEALIAALETVATDHGATSLMGRTRMQAAIAMTVADRVAAWIAPLRRRRDDLDAIERSTSMLQFAGPVGTLDKLGTKREAVRMRLADDLGLSAAQGNWQNQRDGLAGLAGWASLVSGNLGKIGQDVALMAQNGIDEIALEGGGGSSAMAHKRNPVRAEILVSLARFSTAQLSGMHHALIHEQERSGAAWTLEWMILPQMMVATGAALTTAIELAGSIQRIGSASR